MERWRRLVDDQVALPRHGSLHRRSRTSSVSLVTSYNVSRMCLYVLLTPVLWWPGLTLTCVQASKALETARLRTEDDIGVMHRSYLIVAVAFLGIVLMVLDEELMWSYGNQYLCVGIAHPGCCARR